mmetsp:Transcript_28353/g.25163  ORF Transcript_28353/g.25163 Transcript_28353/m.25163 type:complete len:86 (-) Transcript_28353:1154-1411(-)
MGGCNSCACGDRYELDVDQNGETRLQTPSFGIRRSDGLQNLENVANEAIVVDSPSIHNKIVNGIIANLGAYIIPGHKEPIKYEQY